MSPAEFLRDLVNSVEVRRAFPPIANAFRTEVVSEVKFSELRVRQTSMDLFDRLTESGLVDSAGSIRKILPDYIDGVEISDRVREVLVVEESDNYGLFSEDDRSEFLFKIFSHLVLGGGLCQYEDEVAPYLTHTKELYKDLVAVSKDPESEEMRIISRVYELHSNAVSATQDLALFSEDHRQNFLYVCVDPSYRHVNLWWHKWQSAWG